MYHGIWKYGLNYKHFRTFDKHMIKIWSSKWTNLKGETLARSYVETLNIQK
jgi:hypothetical protein